MTIAQKVALVQAQVAKANGWTSTYIGGRLSFKYKGVNAPIIAPLFDSSGETNQFDPPPGNPPPGYAFDFGIGGTRASGVNGSGTSSFVQVATETGCQFPVNRRLRGRRRKYPVDCRLGRPARRRSSGVNPGTMRRANRAGHLALRVRSSFASTTVRIPRRRMSSLKV